MASVGAEAATATAPSQAGLGSALQVSACLAAFGAFLFWPHALADGDTFWHVAAGEWMLQHLQVPHADPFSLTHHGQRWVAHEWLAEVVMAAAHRLLGWPGVLALYAGAYAAALGGTIAYVGRWLSARGVALVLILVIASSLHGLLMRPLILALPVMVFWTLGLLRARDEARAPDLRLALLMALWSNLHGSFVFGFVLASPFALEALLEQRRRPWPVVRDWGVFALASLAAGAATPHGLKGYLYPFEILTMKNLNAIVEWRPADFGQLTTLQVGMFVTLFACLARGVRLPPLRAALLLFLLYMALKQFRQEIVLAFLAPLLLSRPIAAVSGTIAPRTLDPPGFKVIVTIGWALMLCARLAIPVPMSDSITKPVTAMRHVPAALAAQPVFNGYGFGGYLIFNGVRPFIDGRSDMYGDSFFARYLSIVDGDQRLFKETVDHYGISWTILPPDAAATLKLDERPGWRRLYGDKYAVVHVRDGAPLGSKDPWHQSKPDPAGVGPVSRVLQ